MRVERVSSVGSQVLLRVVATADEFHEAARKGVRAFLLAADAPIPADDQLDTILSQIMGSQADIPAAKRDFAANYLVPRAVSQESIMPVCSPDFSAQGDPEQGDDFIIEIKVFPKPALELASYDPVDITVQAPRVSEEEIDARVRELVRQFGAQGEDNIAVGDELDDAWVRDNIPDPQVNTVQGMREALRKAGEQYKLAEFEQYKVAVGAAELAKRLTSAVPADIINAMADSMISELRAQAVAQGTTISAVCEERGMDEDAMRREALDEATSMLQQGLALDAVFRHECLSIDEQDRAAALRAIAPGSEEEAEEQLCASGYAFTIEETAQRLRAGRFILEHARVTIQA